MTYEECIAYLYSQLPVFHRVGSSAFKKGLDNTFALVSALGNPHHKFKSIHIAGTNGKGSSSNMLAAMLQAGGYKTGLYTSPHLKEFTERIKINGHDIPADYLIDFVGQHKKLFEEIKPSFFEMTVALAFKYFAEQEVDIAIIEVGLGGRLDSTNIITPLISLITNISYDHQDLLGNTLESIAREKAGIIKPGVPVIISKTQPGIDKVFGEVAGANQAEIYFADQIFGITAIEHDHTHQQFEVIKDGKPFLTDLKVSLGGQYQRFNLPGVLGVVQLLSQKNFGISEENIRQGLGNVTRFTNFKGRWQILRNKPLTICDSGHNEDGIKQVVAQLKSLDAPQVHVVLGVVKDKDVTKVLRLLPSQYEYYFCQASLPRALPAAELKALAENYNLQGNYYPDVNTAIGAAQQKAAADEVIFIGGSTFVVAEIENL